jgi:tetratricopeptide (TPR) repeat protein
VECHQEVLDICLEHSSRDQAARVLVKLGNDFCDRAEGDHQANLGLGIAYFREALSLHGLAGRVAEWTRTLMNLGSAYRELTGEGAENQERALACYEQALQVWTRDHTAWGYAALHNNIANVLMTPPIAERPGSSVEAIAHYREALTVRTRARNPDDFALTEYNLGQAYMQLGSAGGRHKAAKCFEAVLETVDRRRNPWLHSLAVAGLRQAATAAATGGEGSSGADL